MDSLPQEMIDRISGYLPYNDLKNTLLVSRRFSHAAERESGAFSRFDLNGANADNFLTVYSTRRWRYLRHVEFRTHLHPLPAIVNDPDICYERPEELREWDIRFTRQIKFLFDTIARVEDKAKEYGPGRLQLTINTPSRLPLWDWCMRREYIGWRVHLLSAEKLPQLYCVRSLFVRNPTSEHLYEEGDATIVKLDLRVLIDLSGKLPNLESLKCKLGMCEWTRASWDDRVSDENLGQYTRDWDGPRRDSRNGFASALQEKYDLGLLPPSLRSVDLDFLYPWMEVYYADRRDPLANMVEPLLHDHFSSSLRLLSQQLRRMYVRLVADATLFWPNEKNSSTPSWPNLESLEVVFCPASPSGLWYFHGPEGEGHLKPLPTTISPTTSYPPLSQSSGDCQCGRIVMRSSIDNYVILDSQFHVIPTDEMMIPFLTGFAKAAATMRNLREVALWGILLNAAKDTISEYRDRYGQASVDCVQQTEEWLAWGLAYAAPGGRVLHASPGTQNAAFRQLWWHVGNWRPSEELYALMRRVGGGGDEEELVEYWHHDRYRGGLVSLDVFKTSEMFGDSDEDYPKWSF
ncbi:unnamed protein product [Periconia digitata]|uniref:F-box domain-containing protein n=1 Tax=Periconia digitata TaxID=1303443 RepID=A0A9W4UJV8_9PLEO|nr:unnamed protein product [Periconia digitata]